MRSYPGNIKNPTWAKSNYTIRESLHGKRYIVPRYPVFMRYTASDSDFNTLSGRAVTEHINQDIKLPQLLFLTLDTHILGR